MTAPENFYRTQYRRLLRFCRRMSGNSKEPASERSLKCIVGQQHAEGSALSSEALPPFPGNDQIAQGGGNLLYRERGRHETERIFLPWQHASVQVFLSPSYDTSPAAFLPSTPARWSTQAEQAGYICAGPAQEPKQWASRECVVP